MIEENDKEFVFLNFYNDPNDGSSFYEVDSEEEWVDHCKLAKLAISHSYLISKNNNPLLKYWSPEEGFKTVSHHLIGDPSLVYKLVKVLNMNQKDIELLNVVEGLLQELKADEIVRIARWLLDKYENWEN